MALVVPPSDVLLALMGAPHTSDTASTALRTAQALLERGGTVQVWTCGYATGLTQESLGSSKPRNVVEWARDHPSTATVARGMIQEFPDRLSWFVCRFCSEERGTAEQIPEVRRRPPFKFGDHVSAATKTIFLGVI
ncbi:hypothetical protein [Streptomyces sp. TS71-3]|uniref:hypothetical protein n=1 Tax=Streptomyces sp. TS71-3 TaxID=2733862 RepID=UPI001B29C93F|nr:hypothetical protein [Streptomyces sp. TS71-3]GHJ36847.1 hypothetical protein Sm713_24560 [Streptomyces sp. TS71-3]